MTTRYSISFDSTREIPSDVLLEHVAYHLRSLTSEGGAKLSNYRVESHLTARAHPFDGEELFDDDETPEEKLTFQDYLDEYELRMENGTIVEPEIVQQNQKPKGRAKGTFPNLLALLDAKKGKR